MKLKEESEKAGLKLNIQNTKIMVSDPITSWQIDGKTMESVTDFIFFGPKITADGGCSYELNRCLLLGRRAVTNLGSILKSRNITFIYLLIFVYFFFSSITFIYFFSYMILHMFQCHAPKSSHPLPLPQSP